MLSSLAEISLGILASVNSLNEQKERLIEIAEDGTISSDELPDFLAIQDRLEKLALTVDSLKLWVDHAVANEQFDTETLKGLKK